MSKVEELLAKYNPDVVPNKLLVECSLIDYGYPFASSMFTDDSSYIPIIRIRDVKPGKASTYYMGNYSKEYIVKRGDILVGMDGEFNLEKWNDIDSLLNQRVARITEMPSKSTKGYLYHILGPIFKKIEREISGGSVKHLSVKIINSISIPLPHIKVQEEIVKILDSFTNLIDALNEELSLRQKQFEYYREKLLTFDECECEWKKLGDILDYEQPSKYIVSSSEYDDNYDIPVLTAGQTFILGYTDEKEGVYKASKKNPTIIFDDFTTGHHWVDFDFKIKSSAMKMLRLKNNKSLLRYIFYSMALINYVPTEHSRQWISKYSQFEIPLPNIKDQECIVNSLDNFTNLISSLKEEIALRQKQYEYYREKLLTFD